MLSLCKKLGITSCKVQEKRTGLVKEIAGSPDIKGMCGTDKRKYLIDLMRVHPRDANYPDSNLHSAYVVRDQLLKIYNGRVTHPNVSLKHIAKMS